MTLHGKRDHLTRTFFSPFFIRAGCSEIALQNDAICNSLHARAIRADREGSGRTGIKESSRILSILERRKDSYNSQLFISLYNPVVSLTIERWIKSVLGIDTIIFKAHSVRGASTSAAANAGMTTNDMQRIGVVSVFQKFHQTRRGNSEFHYLPRTDLR